MPRLCLSIYCTLYLCVGPDNSWIKQSGKSGYVFTLNAISMSSFRLPPEVALVSFFPQLADNILAQNTTASPFKASALYIGIRMMFCCYK